MKLWANFPVFQEVGHYSSTESGLVTAVRSPGKRFRTVALIRPADRRTQVHETLARGHRRPSCPIQMCSDSLFTDVECETVWLITHVCIFVSGRPFIYFRGVSDVSCPSNTRFSVRICWFIIAILLTKYIYPSASFGKPLEALLTTFCGSYSVLFEAPEFCRTCLQ